VSNWAVVIVTWSGIDKEAEPHDERWAAISEAYKKETDEELSDFTFFDSLELGYACECVAIGGMNHFDPVPLIIALGKFKWEYREEVCVILKDEYMDRYQIKEINHHE
jgi:hypothetical protein